jgi:hypothetical protein
MASTVTISGAVGTVTAGGGAVPVTGWTITQKCDTREVTDSNSSTVSEFIAEGHTEWEGTFEGWVQDGTATLTIGGAAAAGTFLAVTGTQWAGNIIITSKNIVLQVKGSDAVKVSYAFKGTGALTETNA